MLIMDAANLVILQTIPLSLDDQGRDNPQGIAVSPDGDTVLVSSGTAGGSVYAIRAADGGIISTFTPGPGLAPLGVAFDLDAGSGALVAVASPVGASGSLIRFSPQTGVQSEPSLTVGAQPTGIAVTPDGPEILTLTIEQKTALKNGKKETVAA